MKKFSFHIVITVICLIVIYFFIKEKRELSYYKTKIVENNKIVNDLSLLNETLIKNQDIQNKFNVSKLHNSIIVNTSGRQEKLADVIGKNNFLVFYINKNACDICIKQEIGIFKRAFMNTEKTNVIFLTNYENIRQIINFQNLNNINYPTYIIEDSVIRVNAVTPVVFTLNNLLEIKSAYITSKNLPKLSEGYYNNVKEIIQ